MITAIHTGYDSQGRPFGKKEAREYLDKNNYTLSQDQQQKFLSA